MSTSQYSIENVSIKDEALEDASMPQHCRREEPHYRCLWGEVSLPCFAPLRWVDVNALGDYLLVEMLLKPAPSRLPASSWTV
jgi:hypothetical protein